MLEHAGDELIAKLADTEAAGIVGVVALEEVGSGFQIIERHVEMRAAAGAVGEGLGHEGGEQAFLGGVVLGHGAEEDVAVAHGQGVGVFEVELELRVGVLVIQRVEVPAKVVDGGGNLVDPLVALEEGFHVITGFGQIVLGLGNLQGPVFGEFDDVEFALDAEVHAESHFRRFGELFLECDAGADFVGLALEGVIRREPSDFLVPWQDTAAGEVGERGDFIVVRTLAEAVEGVAGVELAAGGEVLEVIDRHEFPLGHAMDIHERADAVFDSLFFEVVAHGADLFFVHTIE